MTCETAGRGPAGPDETDQAEQYCAEDEVVAAARARAQEPGCAPVSPAAGAALRFLATVARARAVVEVGTGTGVSGLYLLSGMTRDGVLTSIDVDPEQNRAARDAFTAAGHASGRARLILGRGSDVLPRLTGGGYDLVFLDAVRGQYPSFLEQGVHLLRPGGVIAFAGASGNGGAVTSAMSARRDADAAAVRELADAVREDERLVPAFFPIGGGLLVASKPD